MSQFGSRTRAFFDRVFPERQIYHRSGGTVRYVALSPSKQALIALAGVGIAGWCAYASVNVVMGGQFLSGGPSDQNERTIATYKRWLAEARARESAAQSQLQDRTQAFNRATEEFERRHETLKLLLDFAGGSSATANARPVERDGAKLLMQASIEEAEPRVSRDWDQSPSYTVQTVGFKAKVDKIKNDQTVFLAAAEEAAVERAEEIQGVLRMTGVGYSRLVDDTMAQGGPEIDLSRVLGDEGKVDPAFARRVQQVAARVAEARKLDALASATPLAPPLGVEYRETSGFGARVDPFNGRVAFHSGLDMAAFERAPVVTTSPGVVSFAGVRSGYGNVVEIDHGHGFKTRYGHLKDIQVVKGEKVAIGQRVGSMGSTGRSTGTHLHYEVWYRGKAYDPIKFLRAGTHVYEQG